MAISKTVPIFAGSITPAIMNNNLPNLRMMVRAALFTVLIIIGAYVSLPIGEVPVVLSDFFVMLGALILGWPWGAVSAGMYLLLGAIGLPVFAGGTGGLQSFYGPTGGYLAGFGVASVIIGVVTNGRNSWRADAIGLVSGSIAVFALGIAWLMFKLNLSLQAALAAGLLPFIPFNIVKMMLAASVAHWVRTYPLMKKYPAD
ncbi:biotin transporter BioY [Sphingobacteriales bacterium UPWRP_1]|nr:hypothetical protein BVG80_03720 [Sphingobacteriales bacterium TSM_CSM]PSJ73441.1 biotin transporter BioY [Sphingobacteriales bacterium UPWRP_1]